MAGHQAFTEDGDWSLFLSGDLPQSTTWFSLTGEQIPLGRQMLRVSAGDFLLEPMRSESHFRRPTDPTPLFGASIEIRSARSRWNLFAGRSRYPLRLPGVGSSEPGAAGAELVVERRAALFGFGVTLVQNAPILTPGDTGGSQAVASARFDRALSPWRTVFGEAYATSGGLGGRAGAVVRGRNGDLTGALFHFDPSFPLLYPLYRPAETGLDGVRVLVNGEPRAFTDASGFFRVTGLADGQAEVGVDLRSLPPGYEVSGASSRSVPVGGGEAARADFEIARFATLQAAILTCNGTRLLPLPGATVALDRGEAPLLARTNHVGGFAFDGLAGGDWRLVVTGADGMPLAELGVRIEAGEDIRGVIIRLGCDGTAVATGDPRLTPRASQP